VFKKVLIANRGEIALRIAQTLREMGIRVAAVHSDVDRAAPHVLAADEAYALEGATGAQTYLRGEKIIDLARRHGVDAIHPGYGFLSENADFAQACTDAGLVFVGPSPNVIRRMGDKIEAKRLFEKAGVPVLPGGSGDVSADPAKVRAEADRVGYPLLVKAAAGGGGKGMRVVRSADELPAAIEAARREATAAFKDGRVFLERYIERPRHVEIQVFGDSHGNVVHLFERECSIQRRHQKLIEESPSPALTPPTRAAMGEAAVRAAKAIGYTNAGTVEFLLDDAGKFYFLEVNTRLQVEHPVTELTLRLDLVRAQVVVAAGGKLPFTQEALQPQGHAIECRICAEDPARGFLPCTGTILRYLPPGGPDVRIDSGVRAGSVLSPHYDSLLAKLVVWSPTRDEAIEKLLAAFRRFVILGVTTNASFLSRVLDHAEFRAGRLHTYFLEEHGLVAAARDDPPIEALALAAWAARNGQVRAATTNCETPALDPWSAAGPWRSLA
jgi:3-methylcrotonyl-CoA carboxylase alpha subunit